MAVIHISESEAVRDLSAMIEKARAGEEVIIDDDRGSVRLSRITASSSTAPSRDSLLPRYTQPRLLSEVIADLKTSGSDVTLDDKFGDDLEAVIRSHAHESLRNPWESS
jgi:hypothetical protein